MLKKISAAAAVSVIATTGFAQSLPAGFYMDGKVQVDYWTIGGSSETFGLLDATLGYSNAGNGVPIGFEVDVYTLQFDGRDSTGFSGSLYYDSSFGRISVGLPRAAIDDYIATSAISKNVYFDNFFILQSGSISQKLTRGAGFLLGGGGTYEYGARFDGEFGGAKYGISYHAVDGDDVINAAASYAFADNYTVGFGIESLGGGSDPIYTGSLNADFGDFSAVAIIRNMEPFGTVYTLEGNYNIIDSVDLTVGYSNSSDGGGGPFAGEVIYADAQYSFMENGYIGVNVTSLEFTSDAVYTVYAGWNLNYGG